ncbi:MAG: hypothetical protein PXX77_06130, partial [Gallionella sp.]|nr:hypothetical protein [Gallionella sp.]
IWSIPTISGTGALAVGTALTMNANSTFGLTGMDLINNGTMSGDGTINLSVGNSFTNNGTINPGGVGTVGALTINGNTILGNASVLNFDLGGVGGGQSDSLNVFGNATLAGTVNGQIVAAHVPVFGSAYPVLYVSGSASGVIPSLNLPLGFTPGYNLAAGEALRMIYSNNVNTFTNLAGGLSWTLPGNWSGSVLPSALDIALISAGYSVVHDTGADTVTGLFINGGNALNVSGGSLTVSGTTTLNGALTVSGTGAASFYGLLDGAATGQVNVTGGILNLSTNSSISSFNLGGGTVNAPAGLNVGNFNHSGGWLNGTGTLVVTNSFNQAISNQIVGGLGDTFSSISITQVFGNLLADRLGATGSVAIFANGDVSIKGVAVTGTGLLSSQDAVNIQSTGWVKTEAVSAASGSIRISGDAGVDLDTLDWTPTIHAQTGDVHIGSAVGNVMATYWANVIGQNVNISAAGSVSDGAAPNFGTITANALNVVAGGGINLNTAVANIATNNSGTGNTLINNKGVLMVGSMGDTLGSVTLNNGGNLTVSGISANGLNLTASGTTSDILVNGSATSSNGMTVVAGQDILVGPGGGALIATVGPQTITAGRDISVIQQGGSAYVESWTGLQTLAVGRDLLVQVTNNSGLESHIESSAGQTISVGRNLTMNALDIDQARINNYGGNQFIAVGGDMTLNAVQDIAHIQSTAGTQTINVAGNLSMSGKSSFDNAYLFGALGQTITVGGKLSMLGGTGAADIASNGSLNLIAAGMDLTGGVSANGQAILISHSDVKLGSGAALSAGAGGNMIIAAQGNFFNNSGITTPITAGNAIIYVASQSGSSLGGMVPGFTFYGCSYGNCTVNLPKSGIGFVYRASAQPNSSQGRETELQIEKLVNTIAMVPSGFIGDKPLVASVVMDVPPVDTPVKQKNEAEAEAAVEASVTDPTVPQTLQPLQMCQ